MSLLFTNQALIWLAALIAVPVLVHLFARSKPTRYLFSDNRFLKKILKKTARFQKPQDWIILLLRTLAVIAILMAFLGPLLVAPAESSKLGEKRSIVLVIDRSASMAAIEGSASRYDLANKAAITILKNTDYDLANVVWIDSVPDAIFPEMGGNIEHLEKQIASGSCSHENGAIKVAIDLAVEQVEFAKGKKKIVLISDFQSSAWKDLELNVPKGILLERIGVAEETVANVAVSEVQTIPAQPIVGEKVEITAKVSNFSPKSRRVKVFVDTGGGRSTKEVDVPAWGSSQMIHSTEFSKPAEVAISCRLEEDKFPLDDASHVVVEVKDRLRLGVIGKVIPEPLIKLGHAIPWLEVRQIENVEKAKIYDYVFIHEWQDTAVKEIKNLLSENVTVLITPAINLEAIKLNELLNSKDTGSLAVHDNEEGWSVIVANPKHKAMSLFATGEYGVPGEGSHRRRHSLNKKLSEQHDVLLTYEDGIPALLRVKNLEKGALLMFNMLFDSEYTDWVERSSFVSFMAEMLLSERKRSFTKNFSYPGEAIGYYIESGVDKNLVKLKSVDLEVNLTAIETMQGSQLVSEPMELPGVYKWTAGSNVVRLSAINIEQSESDLRILSSSDVIIGDAVSTKQLVRRASLGDGWKLWPLCIALAFVFLFLELIVANLKPKAVVEN